MHKQEEGGRQQAKNKDKKITEQAKETRREATLLYSTVEVRRAKES